MAKHGREYTAEDKARWQEQYDALLEQSVSEDEAKAQASRLFNEGRGVQVSRRYRMIATLPEGETALEALARCSPSLHKRVMANAERQAAQEYATYCATNDGQMNELDMRTFAEFKKLENGRDFKPTAGDLQNTEDLYGLSDPERERRIRQALLDLDKQRKDAQ